MTAILGMFAGIYHWFPKMYGKSMNKRMGMVHFWVTIVTGYGVFLPMHFLGEGGYQEDIMKIQTSLCLTTF